MNRPLLIFEESPIFILGCIVLGIGYAFLLYRKKSTYWNAKTNATLFVLRSILVAFLASLLLSPILKQIQNDEEQPTVVLQVDNSLSIASALDDAKLQAIRDQTGQLRDRFIEEGFEVSVRTLDNTTIITPDSIRFDVESSDLASSLKQIMFDYEGKNLAEVVLISDGIYNFGSSPTFLDYNFPISTLAVGDTVPRADISIAALNYNKVSYQGNKFPLVLQFMQKGYAGESATISISNGEQRIESRTVTLANDNELQELQFLLDAEQKGFQRYEVRISPKPGELSTVNNIGQAYIDIVEGKENIALIAAAPHPDIKAFKTAIESNSNYSFDDFILSNVKDINAFRKSNKKYDLVIFHHLPDRSAVFNEFLKSFQEAATPTLFIPSGNENMNQFNAVNGVVQLEVVPGEYDRVRASFNTSFENYRLSEELIDTFDELPPVPVPFGKYNLMPDSKVLLYQRVGSITTTKPLIAINSSEPKKAVIAGGGLWLWKLNSYVVNENHEVFNELITKLVQYLSSKEDKRKFKVYPVKNEFQVGEEVVFEAEVYNDLYERVYDTRIELDLLNGEENENYTFITAEGNSRYRIGGLDEGIYSYTAGATIDGERVQSTGEFVVKNLQLENIKLTADFNLLKTLSSKTGGEYFILGADGITDYITRKEPVNVLHTTEAFLPIIHLKWLFFILLGLVSIEWFIRKFSGSY